jgi:hypothetical protein
VSGCYDSQNHSPDGLSIDVTLPSLPYLESLSLSAHESLDLFLFVTPTLCNTQLPSLKDLTFTILPAYRHAAPVHTPPQSADPRILPLSMHSHLQSLTLDFGDSMKTYALYHRWSYDIEPLIEQHDPHISFDIVRMVSYDTPEEGLTFEEWIAEHDEVTLAQLSRGSRERCRLPKMIARRRRIKEEHESGIRNLRRDRWTDRCIARLR